MILTTTKPIDDPRVIRIDSKHPLYFEGSNINLLRAEMENPSFETKKALNDIYRANRDGVCIICCERIDIAIEVRAAIYKKAYGILTSAAGGRTICSCSLTIEYLTGKDGKFTVEDKLKCDRMLTKEFEMFAGFISTPELFLEKFIWRMKLDKMKFTNNHYKWAEKNPFRVLMDNVQALDTSETMPYSEHKRIMETKIELLYLPPNKTVCTTRTSSQSESLW